MQSSENAFGRDSNKYREISGEERAELRYGRESKSGDLWWGGV